MNKSDPNDIVDGFVTGVVSALSDWKTIDGALQNKAISLRRRVAGDAFMSLAVTWESFVSRWVIAAVNKDSTQAIQTLTAKMTTYASTDLAIPQAHVAATLITKSHFKIEDVRRLLDPKEYNVVFRSRAELKMFADEWLAAGYHVAATGIDSYQFCPALVTRLLRNALAHQSSAAITEVNNRVRMGSTPVALRWAGARRMDVDGLRRYLFTATANTPRIEVLHNELATLAGRLKVQATP